MLSTLKLQIEKHRGTLLYTISNVTASASALMGALVCARILDPDEMGAFQTAMLLVTYLGFLPLGVFNGFNRQFPYLLGKGDRETAVLLARTGYSVARVAAVVAAVIAAGQVVFFTKTSGDNTLILAAYAVVPIAVLSQLGGIQNAIVTGQQSFALLAKSQFILAVVTIALLLLVWKFTVWGQAIRLILIAFVPWFIFLSATRSMRAWHWDWAEIAGLVKRGIPILAIGYLYQVFSVADRTLVAAVLGTEAVGHYALAGLAVTAILSVYTPLAVATYSRANHAFGASPQWSVLVKPAKRFLMLISVAVLPLAALIYFTLPVLVPWLLPKYVEGIRAGQIACITSVAFCYCGTSFIFNVTGHNWIYGTMVASAVGTFFLIGFLMADVNLSLERVAWLRASITICLCILTNVYLATYFWRGLKRGRLNQLGGGSSV